MPYYRVTIGTEVYADSIEEAALEGAQRILHHDEPEVMVQEITFVDLRRKEEPDPSREIEWQRTEKEMKSLVGEIIVPGRKES